MVRTVIIAIYLVLFFVLSIPLLGLFWIIRQFNPMLSHRMSQWVLSSVCDGLVFLAGIKLEIRGALNIPKNTPVLFVGNHTSYFDIVVMLSRAKDYPIGFVAKKEMIRIPSFNTWMSRIDCIFLDREDIRAGMKSILDSIENIKSGISMVIFPEGTRFNDGVTHEFKGGSLKIATKSGCPIIPVSINGGENVFEKHVPKIISTKVVLTYGEPIYVEKLDPDQKKHIAEYVRDKVVGMFNS